jgi:hypothetical protein
MDSAYMNALLVAIVFFSIKMIENKFNKDETTEKPLKQLVKDTLIVYVCSIVGYMIYSQFFPSGTTKSSASAFVNNPDF